MPNGEILKLEVKVLYTVGDVKAIIMSMTGFPIFVKDWYGKTLVLDVLGEDKVSDVKSKIHGLPDDLYYLVFAGKALKDDQDLASYFIRKDSHLHIYVRLFNSGPNSRFWKDFIPLVGANLPIC
ncbi:hypothetical protein Acr_02g0010220 [Actinidia rufa]|uniref:Ubiquitin-like domain-containing protein n=1 Tax=Actinidia rufa TaxID=165716 RepID=A0A7J0E915_9ERIC|nr:hypothetical protein Acr_02g0010220 [Actinidia rufa]